MLEKALISNSLSKAGNLAGNSHKGTGEVYLAFQYLDNDEVESICRFYYIGVIEVLYKKFMDR
jgi:hypothetical protein